MLSASLLQPPQNMSIQRSQSVPHSIAHAQSSLPRSMSHQQLPRNTYKTPIRRATSLRASPMASPRTEREDPFSLAGFFPTSLSTESEDWRWIREEEEEHLEGEEEESHESSHDERSGSVMSRQGNEELTRAIRDHDKMGVLSMGEWSKKRSRNQMEGVDVRVLHADEFLWKKSDYDYDEERLLSPYSEEEAVDFESLHQTLQGLRRETCEGIAKATRSEARYGDLFLREEK